MLVVIDGCSVQLLVLLFPRLGLWNVGRTG